MSDRMKVLIVEDNALCREVSKGFIEELGHECLVAENGQEVLDLYERFKPDAVLMDIIMPGVSGIEAVAALLSRYLDVPVVFVSSLDAFPEGTASEIAEQLDIHRKPTTVDQMRVILNSLPPQSAPHPVGRSSSK